MAIVISQPRFDIVPVTTAEIDAWFESLGFRKITEAAYYRVEDNLGVFDAHDKEMAAKARREHQRRAFTAALPLRSLCSFAANPKRWQATR